jgi:hypothetical protein
MDCQGAEEVLRQLLIGASVDEEALQEAQSHLESCPLCAARREGRPRRRFLSGRKGPARRRGIASEPAELIERVLIEALSDPEPIVRARAAEELSLLAEPSRAVPEALVRLLLEEPDARVCQAAAATLARLAPAASEQEPPSTVREQSA